jgi:ABC-2 type transport system ATP-binding protein
MLTGILAPTAGELSVLGRDPHRDRKAHVRDIGVVFGQRTQLWWDLAVVEAYTLLASIFEVPKNTYDERLRRLDDLLALGPLLHTPVRELSLGQRMRCELGAALLHGPKVLFLDEPTIGLDVAVKHRIRDFVRTLRDAGTTVLLTTHDLSDVEALCRRIVLIDHGRVLFDGTPDALKARLGGRRQIVVDVASGTPPLAWGDGVDATFGEGQLVLSFGAEQRLTELLGKVLEQVAVNDLAVREPSIDTLVAAFYERGAP